MVLIVVYCILHGFYEVFIDFILFLMFLYGFYCFLHVFLFFIWWLLFFIWFWALNFQFASFLIFNHGGPYCRIPRDVLRRPQPFSPQKDTLGTMFVPPPPF